MAESHKDTILLPFHVGPYCFCVDAFEAEAIIEMPSTLTSVPLVEDSIIGVFLYHDRVAKVISLRRKFGLEESCTSEGRLLILSNMESGLTGFCVDSVSEIISSSDISVSELSEDINITAFKKFVLKEDIIMMWTKFETLLMIEDVPRSTHPCQPVEDSDSDGSESVEVLIEQTEEPVKSIETPAPHVPENRTPYRKDQDPFKESCAPSGNDKPSPAQHVSRAPFSAGNPSIDAVQNIYPHTEMKIKKTHSADYKKNHSFQTTKMKDTETNFTDSVKIPSTQKASQQQTYSNSSWKKSKVVPVLASFLVLSVIFVLAIFFRPNIREKTKTTSEADKGFAAITQQKKSLYKNSLKAFQPKREINAKTLSLELMRPKITQPVNKAGISITKDKRASPSSGGQDGNEFAIKKEDNGMFAIETKDFSIIVERPLKIGEKNKGEDIVPPEIVHHDKKEMVHIVVKGDTLWDIAKHYLGDPFKYMILAEVSRIKDPDMIYPDDKISIIMKDAQNF